jgi:hypothetical protein
MNETLEYTLPDVYMVEPALIDGSYEMHGELPENTLRKVRESLEETVDQLGIPRDQVLFCPTDTDTEFNHINQQRNLLEQLASDVAVKQDDGTYDTDPLVLFQDSEAVRKLKAEIDDPHPDYLFVGWDSFTNEEASSNPVIEAAETGRIGVYDLRKLPDGTGEFSSVRMTAKQLEETRIFDFYPRFADATQVVTYLTNVDASPAEVMRVMADVVSSAKAQAETEKATLVAAGMPNSGNEAMAYLAALAASDGAVSAIEGVTDIIAKLASDEQ